MTTDVVPAALILILLSAPLPALQARPHASHGAAADERGDRVMGFDHTKTTHHFLLAPDGGTIEISVNDPTDGGSRDRIRSHLAHIAISNPGAPDGGLAVSSQRSASSGIIVVWTFFIGRLRSRLVRTCLLSAVTLASHGRRLTADS